MVRSGPRCSSGANCSVQLHHGDDEDDHSDNGDEDDHSDNDEEDDHSYNDEEEDTGDDNNFHKLSN